MILSVFFFSDNELHEMVSEYEDSLSDTKQLFSQQKLNDLMWDLELSKKIVETLVSKR